MAQVFLDEFGHSQRDLVRADAANQDHFLELVELFVVWVGKWRKVGLLAVVELFESVRIFLEKLTETFFVCLIML